MKVDLYLGDSLKRLHELEENSIDSICTDPPYEIGMMGKSWDSTGIACNVDLWKECLRVLKPGGHLLAFSATRTYHRMTVAIEDAGFEIRDMMQWLYGSGMAKGQNISKALDKLNQSGEAKKFDGFMTCLKPANEPICLARKPLSEDTVAKNVLKWSTSGLNIGASRLSTRGENVTSGYAGSIRRGSYKEHEGYERPWKDDKEKHARMKEAALERTNRLGRYPSNVILTHSDDCELVGTRTVKSSIGGYERKAQSLFVAKEQGQKNNGYGNLAGEELIENWKCSKNCPIFILDQQAGFSKSTKPKKEKVGANFKNKVYGKGFGGPLSEDNTYDDFGSASRFFYTAKVSKTEKTCNGNIINNHATVKPISLLIYLIRLISPPEAVILDPFMGSGSTGVACIKLDFDFKGVELEQESLQTAHDRISYESSRLGLLGKADITVHDEKK